MKLKDDVPRLRRLYLALCEKGIAENVRPSRLTDTKPGYENHHIQPVAWGGVDHPLNLVRLTYRQHYIAHLILSAIVETKFNLKGGSSRGYAVMKTAIHEKLQAIPRTPEALARAIERARIQDNSKRKKPTYASNKLRSEANKGKVFTCPNCGKSGGGGMTRWHFDNCKMRNI